MALRNKLICFCVASTIVLKTGIGVSQENLPQLRTPRFKDQILIFDIKKNIPLNAAEKGQKDFYINAGTGKGLFTGAHVNVFRRQAVYDPYMWKFAGELKILVGEMKIIHADADLSVARMTSSPDFDQLPVTDYPLPMRGDVIEITGSKPLSASLVAPLQPTREPAQYEYVVLKAATPHRPQAQRK